MGSHQTPLENRRAQALQVGEVGGSACQGPVSSVAATLSASPESHRRLSPGLGGGILQAPWPNHALQPTPWIAVAFPSPLVRRG